MSPRGGVSSRWPHPGWVVSAVLALCCVYLLSNPFNSRGGNYKLQPCPRNCERKSLTSAQIQPTRYVNDTIASLYIEDFHKLPFQGGHARNDYAGWASAALSRIQRDAGIHGGIGEIGVHTGKDLALHGWLVSRHCPTCLAWRGGVARGAWSLECGVEWIRMEQCDVRCGPYYCNDCTFR